MSRQSYIPVSISGLLEFGQNAVTQFTLLPPATFGLTEPQVAAFMDANDVYVAACNKANDENTRGPLATRQRDTARKAFIEVIRTTMAIVQAFPGTTDNLRQALRITIRDPHHTPAPIPTVAPVITVTGVSGNVISVQLLDEGDPYRRAKPEGVKGATLFWAIGSAPPPQVSDWTYEGTTTRRETKVVLPPSVPGGTSVWITAFWFNVNTASGPAATPVQAWTQVTASNPATASLSNDQQPRLAA